MRAVLLEALCRWGPFAAVIGSDNHADDNSKSRQPVILSVEGHPGPVFSRLSIMYRGVCLCVCKR